MSAASATINQRISVDVTIRHARRAAACMPIHQSRLSNRETPERGSHAPNPEIVDSYLDHLRVERRLANHSLESYARDLRALAEYAAGEGRALEALDRAALE